MTNKDYRKVLKLLNIFKKIETWTKVKTGVFEEVKAIMRSGEHLDFRSNAKIHGSYVGTYYTEKETHQRRGNLLKFRGKRIMVICVRGGSRYIRHYLVATIEDK